MPGQDTRQLLLQVDASVALAQRNLGALASQVERDTQKMEGSLGRPERAIANLERALGSMNQVIVASANQQRVLGQAADRVTSQELRAAQAIAGFARGVTTMNVPVQVATRQQIEAAQAIAGFAMAAGGTVGPLGQMKHGSGQARLAQMELMHVVRASADQFGAGAAPMQIFVGHLGQVAQMAALSGDSLGKFGTVMQGWWGIAITAGIVLLSQLIAGHQRATASAHEHETAEETMQRALRGEADAIQKVTDAIRERNAEVQRSIQLDNDRAVAARNAAQRDLAAVSRERVGLQRQLEQARDQLRGLQAAVGEDTTAAQRVVQSHIASLETQLGANSRVGENARFRAENVNIERSRELSTNVGRINTQFDVLQRNFENLVARSLAGARTQTERERITRSLDAAEEALRIQRARAVAAAQQLDQAETGLRNTRARTNQQAFRDFERELRTRGVTRAAGLTGYRTAAQQHAQFVSGASPLDGYRRPSRHQTWEALDPTRASHSESAAYEAAEAAGLRNFQIVRESGGRIHYEWRGHGRAGEADPSSGERAAREAEALADRRARGEERFQSEIAGLNVDLVEARRQQVQTADEAAAFEIEQIEAQRDRRNEQFRAEAADRSRQDQVNTARYNAEAEQAITLNNQVAAQRVANVRAQQEERVSQERLQLAEAGLRGESEIEQLHARLAETAQERRASALRLLDLSQEQERLELEAVLVSRTATDTQKQIARAQLSRLDMIRRLTVEGINRDNEGPHARYMRELRSSVGDLDTRLEELDVRAMQALDDATRNALKSVLGLHGAFGDIIADLAMIYIRRAALAGADALFGGGGKGGSGGFGDFLSAVFGGGGSGGGSSGFDPIAYFAKAAGSSGGLPGFADGGIIDVGGRGGADRNILSINGVPRARVSASEKLAVLPKMPQVQIPGRAAAAPPQLVRVQVGFDNDMLYAKIVEGSAGVIAEAEPRLTRAAVGATFATARRPGLA